MKHLFENKKLGSSRRIAAISLSVLLLISSLSLSSCGFLFGYRSTGDIVRGTYGSEIKLTPGGNNDSSTDESNASDTASDPIHIIEPGVLDIHENPTVTDNKTAFTDIVAEAEKCVVEIETESTVNSWTGQYIQPGAGSGVIVAHDPDRSVYYIVTNNHVIEGAESILVRLSDGTEYENAQLIATDMLTDVALVAIATEKNTELKTAVLMNQGSTLVDGQDIFVIGNPLGELGGSVTKGIISKTERLISVGGVVMRLLQLDAAVNPGNSGGALFDMSGNLIGIVNAKYSDESVEGIGFAIPINTVRNVIQQLAQKGYVSGRPGLGFETADKAYSSGSIFGSSTTYPTVVADTNVNGSYKDDSGNDVNFEFQKDDIIAAVGTKEINSTAALLSRLTAYEIGDAVTVTVLRTEAVTQNGRVYYTTKQYEVNVILVEYVPTITK